MSRIARWSLILTTLAACAREPNAPPTPAGTSGASALTAEIVQLPSGGTSNTIMAKAVSPKGWVLGNFYLNSGGPTRAQSWAPYPDFAVATITDPGSIYSAADDYGDVTAHISGRGQVVYFADPVTGGQPYTIADLPLPADAGNPGNWVAYDINEAHLVVGMGYRGNGVANPVVWVPVAPGAMSWLDPISLPLPTFPLGIDWVFTVARGVNDAGLVVGGVTERLQRGTKYHAWLWRVEQQGGSWVATSLGELPWDPKALDQQALDVNDAGVVSGYVRDNGNEYAALWAPDASGSYTEPPRVRWVPEWNATHVNRCGWTVSSTMSAKGGDGSAVAWNGVTAITLPKLAGSSSSQVWDINDSGFVAGRSTFTGKGKAPNYSVPTVWRGHVPPCP